MATGSLQASYRGAVRKYGFEGEAGREGEGATRITESSYRRQGAGQSGLTSEVAMTAEAIGTVKNAVVMPLREMLEREHARRTAARERSAESARRLQLYHERGPQRPLMTTKLSPADLMRCITRENAAVLAALALPALRQAGTFGQQTALSQHQAVAEAINEVAATTWSADCFANGRRLQVPKMPIATWNYEHTDCAWTLPS